MSNHNTCIAKIMCINFSDGSLRNTSFGLGAAVMMLSAVSFIISILTLGFGAFAFMVCIEIRYYSVYSNHLLCFIQISCVRVEFIKKQHI